MGYVLFSCEIVQSSHYLCDQFLKDGEQSGGEATQLVGLEGLVWDSAPTLHSLCVSR